MQIVFFFTEIYLGFIKFPRLWIRKISFVVCYSWHDTDSLPAYFCRRVSLRNFSLPENPLTECLTSESGDEKHKTNDYWLHDR